MYDGIPVGGPHRPLVVLDDDPTGTQALTSARVVCDPNPTSVEAATHTDVRSLHLLTNSRALDPERAAEVTFEAAELARGVAGAGIVLRGDSTLRAHLLEEYRAFIAAVSAGEDMPLILVPALPAAGRVTVNGRHLISRDGERIPLERTEYAQDPDFGYSTSRLVEWAEQRSGGYFAAERGLEVTLARLREDPEAAISEAVATAMGRLPAVVAIDAESERDLDAAAAGIRAAPPSCVRCAPALIGALARNRAQSLVAPDPPEPGVLVVCGSWVPLATRQLVELDTDHPGSLVELDPVAMIGESGQSELERAAEACRESIHRTGLAIMATPRRFEPSLATPGSRQSLAEQLALVVRKVGDAAGSVVAKGGITSAVTARIGLQAGYADVVGPIAQGVSLWVPFDGPRAKVPLAVVPGNVGDDRLLAEVVDRLLAATSVSA